MGTPLFAAHVLETLIKHEYRIVGVVTQPDALQGRKRVLTPSPVKELALRYNIKLFQPHKIRKEYEDLLALDPDLIVTCAYGQIIPKALLEAPRYGCINTHGSLLPKYRGGAPIQRAIMHGEKETGITLMYMNEKMDEGDILVQQRVAIREEDTASTLFNKLSEVAAEMLLVHLPRLFAGELSAIPQDHQKASYAYNLTKEDEFISFREPVSQTSCHIRGLLENPGAFGILDGEAYRFSEVSYDNIQRGEAGTFLGLIQNKIAIAGPDGTVFLGKMQAPGKKMMPADSFFNGRGRDLLNHIFTDTYQR